MKAAAIIHEAQADGVNLALSATGTLKATGDDAAVARWLPTIREHKVDIIAALQDAANDPGERHFAWRVVTSDGERLTVTYSPEATAEQVRAEYPGVTVEPLRGYGETAPEANNLLPAPAKSCRCCVHAARPGLGNCYCGGREDLPPVYGPGHPLRQLPDDSGASCDRWQTIF